MTRLVLALALCIAPLPALAHKIIASVFPSGDAIEGEVGFSNGDMALGATVVVTGPDGAPLGEALTDEDGFFVFTPTKPVEHRFRADLGAGHVAEMTLPAGDVAHILGVAAEVREQVEPEPVRAGTTVASLSTEERQAIAEAVRDEVRPLRREIAAYREKNDLQTILGGIGYIVGIFGLGFYVAARRRLGT